MPPAATAGSQTAHGTPLPGPGSPDILIEGKPAWRATIDFHTCPLSDGPKPHAGGVVSVGSPTVLFNNIPAARVGDIIAEAGPPNTITVGATTVMIS